MDNLKKLIYSEKARSIFFQVLVFLVVITFFVEVYNNVVFNLRQSNITSGFDFLSIDAGFSINQTLIEYDSATSSRGQAILVGLINTLIVAILSIFLASILGLVIALCRLSNNFLISKLARAYVEVLRNIPLLLQLLFWYTGVLKILPSPKNSIELPFDIFLNNRGFTIPNFTMEDGFVFVLWAFFFGIIASIIFSYKAKKIQSETGKILPVFWAYAGFTIVIPVLLYLILGSPLEISTPYLKGFNFVNGFFINPEFCALTLSLSLYTASFIAEIIRAGISGVSQGQKEAASAIGLKKGFSMRLIVLPQALRIIIPPMTSQYLNITKNSSLAVAIGYADFVSVGGIVLNNTGQAIEIVTIWILTYLSISLLTSGLMNYYNKRKSLIER